MNIYHLYIYIAAYITAINSFFKFTNCNVDSSLLNKEIVYLVINSCNKSIIFLLHLSVLYFSLKRFNIFLILSVPSTVVIIFFSFKNSYLLPHMEHRFILFYSVVNSFCIMLVCCLNV